MTYTKPNTKRNLYAFIHIYIYYIFFIIFFTNANVSKGRFYSDYIRFCPQIYVYHKGDNSKELFLD